MKGKSILAYQSKRVGSVPAQDFSLVADTLLTSTGVDSMGMTFSKPGAKLETTEQGNFNIQGTINTGSLSGLVFGTSASVDNSGNFVVASSLLQGQGAWLNIGSNLTGGLVLINPKGVVYAHMSTSGVVHIRGNAYPGLGPF